MDSPSKLSYDTGVLQAIMEMKDSLSMQIKELKLQAAQPMSQPPPLPPLQPRNGTKNSTASRPRQEQKLAMEAMKDIPGFDSGRRISDEGSNSVPLSAWSRKAMEVLAGSKDGRAQQHAVEDVDVVAEGNEISSAKAPFQDSQPSLHQRRTNVSGNGNGLSDIFRAREAVIADNSRKVVPEMNTQDVSDQLVGAGHMLFHVIAKAVGLVPLFNVTVTQDAWTCSDWLRHSMSKCYYFILVIFLVYQAVCLCLQDAGPWASRHVCMIDLALMLCAAFVLTSFRGSGHFQDRAAVRNGALELFKHLQKKKHDEEWRHSASVDARRGTCWTSLVISLRFAAIWRSDHPNEEYESYVINMTLWHVAFCASTFIMSCTTFWQVRTCRGMIFSVRCWCDALLSGNCDCREARAEWRLISALFRRTSRAFQSCVIAYAFMLISMILAALYDFHNGQGWLSLLPAIPLMLLPIRVLVSQAATTTACTRLPSLLALCQGEDQEGEDEYLKLAMYVSFSECGFYLADMCLTPGLVQKFIYFTFAIGGTIAVRIPRFTCLLDTLN